MSGESRRDRAPREWRAASTGDGSLTLVHPLHGEACHSLSGAWTEARERYVAACRVHERMRAHPGRELRVLDVGTGLGLNLAALAQAAAQCRGRVRVTSLELDPDVIRSAMALRASQGPARLTGEGAHAAHRWLGPVHAALGRALARGERGAPRAFVPLGALGALQLVIGDARRTLPELPEAPGFDAVFLDPFSPAVDPALWEPGFLRELARRMAPGSWLATYSAATAVRAGLVAAGLRVGTGGRVGAKREGTLASPDRAPDPLPARVLRRLERRARSLPTTPGRSFDPPVGISDAGQDRPEGPVT